MVVGACGGSASGGEEKALTPEPAGNEPPTNTSAAPGAIAPAGGCDLAPVPLVQEKLGLTAIKGPFSNMKAGGLVCEYNKADGPPALTLQMNSAATAESFARTRDGFTKNRAPVAPITGLGDEAFSSTFTFTTTSHTLVVRKGTTEVLMTSNASAEAIRALMDSVIAGITTRM